MHQLQWVGLGNV